MVKNVVVFATFDTSVGSWNDQADGLSGVVSACLVNITQLDVSKFSVRPIGKMKTKGNLPTVAKVQVQMTNTGDNMENELNGGKVGLALRSPGWKGCIEAGLSVVGLPDGSALLDISSSLDNALDQLPFGLIRDATLPAPGNPTLDVVPFMLGSGDTGYRLEITELALPIGGVISHTLAANAAALLQTTAETHIAPNDRFSNPANPLFSAPLDTKVTFTAVSLAGDTWQTVVDSTQGDQIISTFNGDTFAAAGGFHVSDGATGPSWPSIIHAFAQGANFAAAQCQSISVELDALIGSSLITGYTSYTIEVELTNNTGAALPVGTPICEIDYMAGDFAV